MVFKYESDDQTEKAYDIFTAKLKQLGNITPIIVKDIEERQVSLEGYREQLPSDVKKNADALFLKVYADYGCEKL